MGAIGLVADGQTKQVLLSVALAKSHIANMLPPGRVVSDRVILQEERGAPQNGNTAPLRQGEYIGPMLWRLARFKTSPPPRTTASTVHLIATQAQAEISPQKLELPGRDLIFEGSNPFLPP